MKDIKVNTLGFELSISVPADAAEYDRLARKENACVESAVFNTIYRSTLAKFRDVFTSRVENETSIPRESEPILDAQGQVKKNDDGDELFRYTETEKDYFARVCATLVKDGSFASPEAAAASFANMAQEIMSSIAFDPAEKERAPAGPKKIAKAYVELASQREAEGKLLDLAQKLRQKLGNWKIEDTVESVARAIAEDQRRIREAQKLGDQY